MYMMWYDLMASEHKDAGKIFNICTGVETRLLDLLDVMYELVPNAPQTEFAAPRARGYLSLCWEPAKSCESDGLSR